MENKSRSDILLDERINQVDDINLDKLFDSETIQTSDIIIPSIELETNRQNLDAVDSAFSIEVQPNEFLDSLVINKEEKNKNKKSKGKLNIKNKLLFFSLTSIAVLLSILFIYNLFVLGNLSRNVASFSNANANVTAKTSYTFENDYISFDNGSTIQIVYSEDTHSYSLAQTNWFNSFCNDLTHLFGGKN